MAKEWNANMAETRVKNAEKLKDAIEEANSRIR
jgi:hypothetical protein